MKDFIVYEDFPTILRIVLLFITYLVSLAISFAVEYVLLNPPKSRPIALSKLVLLNPIDFALLVIISENLSTDPAISTAIVSAASAPEYSRRI